jgi:diguanylate cyclase (GGDEF)-like protein/PAS domain S-box-containing protein
MAAKTPRTGAPAQPPGATPADHRALLLADVLEATLDCVCSIDRDWRFTYQNTRAAACLGAGRNLVGRSIFAAFLGIRHSAFRATFRRAMFDREAGAVEGFLPEKQTWYEMNVTPSDGGITVFFRDVSDRRRAEAAQAAASARLRATLDNLPQMVWADWGGSDQFFSRQWIEFTGVDPSAPGAPARIDLVHPDDRDRAAEAWRQAQAEGAPYQAEYRLRHHSGLHRWILSRAAPERDTEGQVVAWYGACTDCHEQVLARQALHASEEHFRSILDSMPHMVWSMAGGGETPDYYNRRWYDFTGIPHGSLQGPEWESLIHPDDQERMRKAWFNSLATGDAHEVEYRLRDRNGAYRWILSRGHAEHGENREILRWYGTSTDIHERMLAREELDRSEKRVKTILDSVPQIIWCAGPDGRIDFVSNKWESMFGSSDELVTGERWAALVHPDDLAPAFRDWQHSVRTGEPYEAEFRLLDMAGDYIWTLVRALPEQGEDGAVLRWYGTCTDIDARVAAEEARNASESLSRGILEASPDCVSLLDLDGTILSLNGPALAYHDAVGMTDLIGTSWPDRLPASVHGALAAFADAQCGKTGRAVVPARGRWWDMAIAPVCGDDGRPFRIVVISRDVTEQKHAEEQAHWAANHDSLTGLPNRALLQQRIEESIDHAAATGEKFGLLLLDIDDFKRINDSVGHDAGDALLCTFARRLRAAVRPEDTVARLGGDEFAAVLHGVTTEAALNATVDRILAGMREPFVHQGRMFDCHASIGGSLFPQHGQNRHALLKNADVALYAAKSAGGGMRVFETKMRDVVQKRASMLSVARDGLTHDRIVPYYQPKVNLRTGAVAGFEALLRWTDPLFGVQMPCTIAAAFEDMTLAAEISDRMIAGVIADLRIWRDAGIDIGHVAVNAAAAEFRRGDFAERLLARLADANLSPARVQIEVTETVFLGRGAEYVERALKTLSEAGVKVALDDFGTGYASLSHLKQFPVHSIKIDRSFVSDLAGGPGDAAIIHAVVNLGRSLGIEVIAEGIETAAQHDFLLGIGCDQGQGYLYGKAAPAAEVSRLLERMPARCRAIGKDGRQEAA